MVLNFSNRAEFERGEQEGWQEIDPNKNPPYTQQELHEFQLRQQQQMLHYQQQLAAMQSQGYGYGVHPDAYQQGHPGVPMGHPIPQGGQYGMPQHPGQGYGQQPHPAQVQYQQQPHPGQMGGHQFYQGQPNMAHPNAAQPSGGQPAIGQQINYNQHPNQYQQAPPPQGQQPHPGQFQQQQHPNQYQQQQPSANQGQFQNNQQNQQLPSGQQHPAAVQAQVKPLASIN